MSEEDTSGAGFITDPEMNRLAGPSARLDFEFFGQVAADDIEELSSDVHTLEKKMHKYKEGRPSFMWIVPTVFKEFYHEIKIHFGEEGEE